MRIVLKVVAFRSSCDDGLDNGDKVRLPPDAISQLKHLFEGTPEMAASLKLVAPSLNTSVFCGILDFSACSGSIELPLRLAEQMGIDVAAGENIIVRDVYLPKARLIVLTPLTADFFDIPDARAKLQGVLGRYISTAVKGSIMSIQHGGSTFRVTVQQVYAQDPV